MVDHVLEAVVDAFGTPEEPTSKAVLKDDVIRWARDGTEEALGALHAYLTKNTYSERVLPMVSAEERWGILSKCYSLSLRNNPTGEWSLSRYEAMWAFAGWYSSLWSLPETTSAALRQQGKSWFRDEYLQGSDESRVAMVNGALEHLFEDKRISKYFDDWRQHPLLSSAYANAQQWVDGGGRSDFMAKRNK
jgi:hypothetical protein